MPPQKTSFSKKILVFSLGIVTGIVLISGTVFVLHKNNLLTGLFINLTSLSVESPANSGQVTVPTADISVLPKQIVQKTDEQIVVLVPKSMASKEYRDSLNNVVNHFNEMVTVSNQELIPALTEMGDDYKNKNFSNFFGNLVKINEINSRGYELISQISNDLERLKAANQTTMDLGAKSLTNTFIEKGEAMTESANLVLGAIDKMLSTGIFNPGVFGEMVEANAIFNEKVKNFNEATQKLLEYIAKRVLETLPNSGR
ncbi:MAG: hypothetical protein AAB885_03910 [Patescibacteria group bacterium]